MGFCIYESLLTSFPEAAGHLQWEEEGRMPYFHVIRKE
jgi:hypothetical protein